MMREGETQVVLRAPGATIIIVKYLDRAGRAAGALPFCACDA